MHSPLLSTKLFVPLPRPDHVDRRRLLDTLNSGIHRRLTLVSAGAGFGKSTLLAAWQPECGRNMAWLSLEADDNNPARFLRYLLAALQRIEPQWGEELTSVLAADPGTDARSLLTALVNAIAVRPVATVLVLDDYHLITSQAIQEAVDFLLTQAPPCLHIAIATREDPPLGLARLRARDQLTDLRMSDLRFTPPEAREFLNRTMGLELGDGDVAALEARTEGWIAGLQMAALSLRGRSDSATFICAFAGSHRFVLDYLVEEVLQRMPESTREFLLQCAILDRLTAPLCDAVTGRSDSAARLLQLERENLFLVPLDEHREWFRYHHLFADVLRMHLQEQDRSPSSLHRSASTWYEAKGMAEDAIGHALAAGDTERAAHLLERAWPVMHVQSATGVPGEWIDALPAATVSASAALSVYAAIARLPVDPEAVNRHLADAEALIPPAGSNDPGLTADEERPTLLGMIAIARAYQAAARGQPDEVAMHSENALAVLPATAWVWRGAASSLLGFTQWSQGNLEGALLSLAGGGEQMREGGDLNSAIGTLCLMADIQITLGSLEQAQALCEQALQLASRRTGIAPQSSGDACVLLAAIAVERGELEQAECHLEHAESFGPHAQIPETRHRRHVVSARIAAARGDYAHALECIDTAADVQQQHNPLPDQRPVSAWRARILLQSGDVLAAGAWAEGSAPDSNGEVSFLDEFALTTLAYCQVAVARLRADASLAAGACTLLEKLALSARAGKRLGILVEILLLSGFARRQLGQAGLAASAVNEALVLAEQGGFWQTLASHGAALAELLSSAEVDTRQTRLARALLVALAPAKASPEQQLLPEPLSEREKTVLHLLASDLSGPQMAERLYISLNTLRTHTRNIYQKLGARNRREAVRLASERGLV
ncbi:MAG: LuxR C-terminal-related transcriptional regulator [Haliea sp.]|uniref:LuxR C-terminal-related transcriptional regulator n=1 Tax=Haliea sp. TaxID=1932666 RepID=UPI0032EFB21B